MAGAKTAKTVEISGLACWHVVSLYTKYSSEPMKNLNTTVVAFFVALALSLSGSAVMADPGEDQGLNFFGKEKDLFVFRTAKGTSDAKVEIYSDSGELVTAQTMQKRKIIIDFGGVAFGTYTIRVTQDGVIKEYQYKRK